MRAFILDLQHPLKHEVLDETAEQIINWSAAQQLSICLAHVKKSKELLAPAPREGNSISYCPRCGCQFVMSAGECADCPGVQLVAFADRVEVTIWRSGIADHSTLLTIAIVLVAFIAGYAVVNFLGKKLDGVRGDSPRDKQRSADREDEREDGR